MPLGPVTEQFYGAAVGGGESLEERKFPVEF